MSVKIVALVLIVILARTGLILGLKQIKNKGYHVLREKNGKIHVGRGRAEQVHTQDKPRERQSTIGTDKKFRVHKNALFQDDKEEIAQNELLVKELALSTDIGGVTKSTLKAKSKTHGIRKKMHQAQKTPEDRRNVVKSSPSSNAKSRKRTSISFPSSPENNAPMSRTLLTAVGLLLDERNHFKKDSNALSLAKVLLDNDKNTSEKHTTHGSDSINVSSLGGLSNILRLLNASVSQGSPVGERKSTIHTELINPTELGISILRLLFGHQAPLVIKPTYKPSFRYNPTTTISPAANPVISTSRLASQMDEFAKGKAIVRKKHRKKSFTFALAKAVSDLIKSMAKQELKKYLQKIHNQPKLFKETQSTRISNSIRPSKKKVDVQGNRKSWVLLKIPKAGAEAIPQQTPMNDEPLEEKQGNEQKSAGIVDTLGKLNDADPLSLETPDKNTGGSSISGVNSEIKVRPTSRVGYKVRILPSLKANVGIQTDSSHVKMKPAGSPQTSPQTTTAFTEAVQKLLQAVQSSIKNLQGKQLIGHPSNVPSTVSDPPPKAVQQQNVHSIVSDQPAKVPERANTASVRGINSDPSPMNDFQEYQKQPVLEGIQVPKQPSIGELSAFTRATKQNELPVHGNILFDPLKDLELAASEPITKSTSPTKRVGPTDNVLFESSTELGTPRNKQESSTVKHIKEDLEIFAEKGLQSHNHYREEHHSSRLRWSDELATQAEKMAYDMAMRGIVQRSEVATSMGYGENVAKITGVPFNDAGSVATDIWYSESSNYSYSYPRVTPQTDAFTQLVWKETKEIGMGCAKDVATNDLYVIALYRPPGNDRRMLRENVVNKGTMTEDVYATIFKRTQQDQM